MIGQVRQGADWVRWHGPELALTVAPTVAAVTVSPWWALLSVAAGGRWVWQETRLRREHPAPPPEPTSAEDERDDEDVTA